MSDHVDMIVVLYLFAALVALDVLALKFGVDSRVHDGRPNL